MIDSSKSGESASRRRFKRHGPGFALAALLGAGLALGGCSTMSDIGEATSDGVSTAANAMNPFNWFGGKDGDAAGEAAESAKQERAVANTATKTGVKSAGRDDLAQRQAAAQDEDRYPKLSTVPERPKDAKSKRADVARTELREGLVADTANAQYTDKELRAQTPPAAAQGAPKGQPDLARSNERVAGEPPAQPAPTMPVAAAPAAPLRAAPAAPPEPPKAMAAAPVVPRVAPPGAVRPQARSGGSSQRQAAAASAAPVSPVAPRTAAPSAAPRTAAPSVAPPAAPSRQAALAQPAPERPQSVLKTEQVATIYFNDGSARLSPDDKQVVGKIAEVVRRTGGALRIVGHSSMGPPSRDPDHAAMVNYKVSLDRAKAVAEALLRSGVPESQVQVMAEGARSPIYAETSRTGAAGNRRTEVYLDYRERL